MKNLLYIPLVAMLLVSCTQPNQIGYVNMEKVVYSYDGMKEAHVKYQNLEEEFKGVRTPIQLRIDSLRVVKSSATTKQAYDAIAKQEYVLARHLQQIVDQQSQELQEQDGELTGAVMNQVHGYTKEFAKEKGYDFILGQKEDNVLFGKEEADVTEALIEYLNKKYNAM